MIENVSFRRHSASQTILAEKRAVTQCNVTTLLDGCYLMLIPLWSVPSTPHGVFCNQMVVHCVVKRETQWLRATTRWPHKLTCNASRFQAAKWYSVRWYLQTWTCKPFNIKYLPGLFIFWAVQHSIATDSSAASVLSKAAWFGWPVMLHLLLNISWIQISILFCGYFS